MYKCTTVLYVNELNVAVADIEDTEVIWIAFIRDTQINWSYLKIEQTKNNINNYQH